MPTGIRLDIQGLRAVAVLAVMIFHADSDWLPGGYIGVDIFFVISGFLITSIILRGRSRGDFSFPAFYLGRIHRIVPAYLVMLLTTTVVMAVILTPGDFRFFKSSLNSALLFLSNVFFAESVDYFAPQSYELALQHTWSLAVEMQFYLLLPFLVMLLPLRLQRYFFSAAIAALTAYVCYRLYGVGERSGVYFSLLARMPEFFIGSLAALLAPSLRFGASARAALSFAGMLLIAGSLIFIDENLAFPGWLALLPCCGAALIIVAPEAKPNRLLSSKPLAGIGDLSYSLYLWHWPVLAALRYGAAEQTLGPLQLMLFVALTFALSWCSYRWIENPFRQRQSGRKRALRYAALFAVLLAAVLPARQFNRTLVPPLPNESYLSADMCFNHMTGDCFRGDRDSEASALLIGDSMAAHLNYFFDVVGEHHHFKVRSISTAGCMPLPGYDIEEAAEALRADCAAQRQAAQPYLESAATVIVAGNWLGHLASASFLPALEALLADAAARHQQVILIAQPPSFRHDPQRLHRLHRLGLGSGQVERSEQWQTGNRVVAALAAKYANAVFVDFSDSPFFDAAPFEDGVLLYTDGNHLNAAGSRRFGEYAKDRLTDYFAAP